MKHLRAVNRKARRLDALAAAAREDVVGLQGGANPAQRPHVPMGCALAFGRTSTEWAKWVGASSLLLFLRHMMP